MPAIDLLRRLLGIPGDAQPADASGGPGSDETTPEATPTRAPAGADAQPNGVACPSCGTILDPPPTKRRLCPFCRQPIVVRQIDGRPAYLTEAAVAVFVAERQRDNDERAWASARREWLRLAGTVGAPAARRARLAGAVPSVAGVEASRALYMTAAERAVREARRGKRWADVGRIRRAQAAAAYADAGTPVPPPDDIVAMHREGMAGVLRELAEHGTAVELISAGCCKTCRSDDGKAFRISKELREPRLPHSGCPKGICGCDWWIAIAERKRRRRRKAGSPPVG